MLCESDGVFNTRIGNILSLVNPTMLVILTELPNTNNIHKDIPLLHRQKGERSYQKMLLREFNRNRCLLDTLLRGFYEK